MSAEKKIHSINMQGVCDLNGVFLDVVAKWPGSHHDSFILRSSGLSDRFEEGEFEDSWLIGDSRYRLKTWLMTPISGPQTSGEKKSTNH